MGNPTPFNLAQLQREMRPWQAHNFPGRESWQPLLGICEELGELMEASFANNSTEMADAVCDTIIFSADYCNAVHWDLHALWITSQHFAMVPTAEPESRSTHLLMSVARLQHAHLKAAQGIRGSKKELSAKAKAALCNILWEVTSIFPYHATSMGASPWDRVVAHTGTVWGTVKQRDWQANKTTGA